MVELARSRSRRSCGQLRPADEGRDEPERDQSTEGELDDEDQTERPDLHREHRVMNQVDEDVERENRHADPDRCDSEIELIADELSVPLPEVDPGVEKEGQGRRAEAARGGCNVLVDVPAAVDEREDCEVDRRSSG